MIGDVQDMAADYESGMLAAATNYHAAIDGRQRGVTSMAGSLAALDQDGAQPAIAMACLGAATFAGTLMVAWRHPRPAGQMCAPPQSANKAHYVLQSPQSGGEGYGCRVAMLGLISISRVCRTFGTER